ncbi:uncharacterized protein LOC114350367 [Ostrinia furnacalis]|uniref:uncharacterized protein LOC114350367 n=1 Tax=Ostrinia furnacalis TaxID=93504 RepID=UPI0010404489|nr:uncharacterized protein LOC114350367 [Ostrinia furnacalis]
MRLCLGGTIIQDLRNFFLRFLIVMLPVLTFCSLVIALASSKPIDEDMLLFWRRSNTESCTPFTTFEVDCNKCVCAADGVPFCTRMLCVKPEDKLQQKEYSDEID